ncbi:hypothetical protein FBR43_12025 [Sphingomonas baiyangensis]|uniref:Uncharacterized protein n=1 Tax=Sphingomonas baiyangensis TaxID=2572576 RepID=A0A4U1L5Q4_9SPHN|nr:hypothetical protein FBR43_12025 [Sphingomonas baiyangensis]
MSAFFASGHAADLILAILAAEALLLRRRGWPVIRILTRLGPGALMIVALRLALTEAAWPWIAVALALSFPLHLADLRDEPER